MVAQSGAWACAETDSISTSRPISKRAPLISDALPERAAGGLLALRRRRRGRLFRGRLGARSLLLGLGGGRRRWGRDQGEGSHDGVVGSVEAREAGGGGAVFLCDRGPGVTILNVVE